MTAILKRTIRITSLSSTALELRDQGFNRFRFAIFEHDRRYVELKAWRYKPRPDNARRKVTTVVTVQNTRGAIHE